jgi:DNA-binding NarL/FixJ family response regulator
MLTIVLADDHQIMLDGLHVLLSTHQELKVIGAATNGVEAIQLVESLKPDLLVLDLSMPDMNGL